METIKYITSGPVRGDCPHVHRTLSGAARCLDRDIRGCRNLGGGAYSDRRVVHADGSPLDPDEQLEVDYRLNQGYCG